MCKQPKLESGPLYLYSCNTSPKLWFKLLGQPRASTQGVNIDWRVHRKQSIFSKLGSPCNKGLEYTTYKLLQHKHEIYINDKLGRLLFSRLFLIFGSMVKFLGSFVFIYSVIRFLSNDPVSILFFQTAFILNSDLQKREKYFIENFGLPWQ